MFIFFPDFFFIATTFSVGRIGRSFHPFILFSSCSSIFTPKHSREKKNVRKSTRPHRFYLHDFFIPFLFYLFFSLLNYAGSLENHLIAIQNFINRLFVLFINPHHVNTPNSLFLFFINLHIYFISKIFFSYFINRVVDFYFKIFYQILYFIV